MNIFFFASFKNFLITITKKPLIFLCFSYVFYIVWHFLYNKYFLESIPDYNIPLTFINAVVFITIYWISYNTLKSGSKFFLKWANIKQYNLLLILYPPIESSLNGILFIVMLNTLLFSLNIQGNLGVISDKIAKVLLLIIIARVFYNIVVSLEKYIINKYIEHNPDISSSRKIHTQLTILKRVIVSLIILLTFIASTMLFDSLKGLGASLLTTAGIISAVGAFASQQSLGRLFAGLQLAFTQPMRIGDTVIIDNEFGQVEEITLSFITIKLWDLKRLILPTDYFTNKGLLNLTRKSTELLGTIFLYADYNLPVEDVRVKFIALLKQSSLWNKKTAVLQVTDIKEKTMEIRCLVSADNASNLWNLRCIIREKLISYIVENHSDCLVKSRNIVCTPKQTEVETT
ncbi:hypothetical protein BH10PSE19_BH10PSE19_04990 [soil metagenome]